jgi:hypothetical protein
MFSGLEAQSEISRLLDELYGSLDRAFLDEAGGRERCTPRRVTGTSREEREGEHENAGRFALEPGQIRCWSFRSR